MLNFGYTIEILQNRLFDGMKRNEKGWRIGTEKNGEKIIGLLIERKNKGVKKMIYVLKNNSRKVITGKKEQLKQT